MVTPVALPDLTPMHAAVGKGISLFASIEFGVGMCFASLMYPAARHVSVQTLNAARSFEAKMKMIDAAANARLEGAELRKWRSLSCKITKRKDFRDKLAHWMVAIYPGIKVVADYKLTKPALVPPIWHHAHAKLYWGGEHNSKERPIRLKEIEIFHERANELVMQLFEFSWSIATPEPPVATDANHCA